MKLHLEILATIVLSICLHETAFATGWTQKKGEGYYKIGTRLVRAHQFYEPDGRLVDIPTFGDYTTSFYGEYGVTDRVTAVVYFPFYKRITLNRQVGRTSGFIFFPGDSVNGIADADVGLRLGILQSGATVLSGRLMLGLPIGDEAQKNGLLTGDGEFNQLVGLELGHSFYPRPAYFTAELGFNNRNEGYSDEVHYGVELGYGFHPRLLLIAHARGLESLKNGDDAVRGGMGGLYANNQRYLALDLELVLNLTDKLGISASREGVARAQNVLSAPAYSFGMFVKM